MSGYQPDRQSVTTAGSSFPGPLKEVVDIDQTLAPTNATPFIKGDTRTGKKVNVRAVHKQDAGLVVAAIDPDLSDVLVYGDVTISFSAMEVHRRGQLVALTCKEFKTLTYLLKNARRVISRDEFLNEVWGYQCYPSTRTVDNHILRLRKKLEPEPALPRHFRTVHGFGYKFLP
jgi:DNA-binding response OmpR family regulator